MFLATMDVARLFTNIAHEEIIDTVCEAYDNFYKKSPHIPKYYLRECFNLVER